VKKIRLRSLLGYSKLLGYIFNWVKEEFKMKKLVVLALAALCVVAFSIPASALEAEFGGYFRTRWWTQQNGYGFENGEFTAEAQDITNFDQRTRLYLTAVFHENLKFVNKFEIDARWGNANANAGGYGADGDIGADGVGVEVKNSYADFDLGPVNFKVGIQGVALGSSFLLDHDFAGAVISYRGDNMAIPFIYIKGFEGGLGEDADDLDVDIFAISPEFAFGGMSINPFAMYWYSDDASLFGARRDGRLANTEELNLWYAGLTLAYDIHPVWAWVTGIYQGGDMDLITGESVDFKAYLAAAGFDVDFGGGMFSLHAEGFYASGDDDDDNDWEMFFVPSTADSYYWAEIMGFGIFDWYTPNNVDGDQIENVWAANLGFTIKPMDKLKISLDGWYAQKTEEILLLDGTMGDKMGIEVDLVVTYQLVEGLNLDIVGAYLFADEVITENDIAGDDDPYLVGSRLSLSF